MKRLENGLLFAAGILAASLTLTLVNGSSAAAQRGNSPPQDVTVVNAAASPVPVSAQGTTSVSGTVGINASANTVKLDPAANTVTIGNLPGNSVPVAIQGSPSVAINNTATNPVAVRPVATAQQTFQAQVKFSAGDGCHPFTGVPQGKVVIESVAGQAFVGPGTQMMLSARTFVTTASGDVIDWFVPLNDVALSSTTHLIGGSQPLRVATDSSLLAACMYINGSPGSGGVNFAAVSIAGHVAPQ